VDVTDECVSKKLKVDRSEVQQFIFPKDTLKTVKQCEEFMQLTMQYSEQAKMIKFDILKKLSGASSTDVVCQISLCN